MVKNTSEDPPAASSHFGKRNLASFLSPKLRKTLLTAHSSIFQPSNGSETIENEDSSHKLKKKEMEVKYLNREKEELRLMKDEEKKMYAEEIRLEKEIITHLQLENSLLKNKYGALELELQAANDELHNNRILLTRTQDEKKIVDAHVEYLDLQILEMKRNENNMKQIMLEFQQKFSALSTENASLRNTIQEKDPLNPLLRTEVPSIVINESEYAFSVSSPSELPVGILRSDKTQNITSKGFGREMRVSTSPPEVQLKKVSTSTNEEREKAAKYVDSRDLWQKKIARGDSFQGHREGDEEMEKIRTFLLEAEKANSSIIPESVIDQLRSAYSIHTILRSRLEATQKENLDLEQQLVKLSFNNGKSTEYHENKAQKEFWLHSFIKFYKEAQEKGFASYLSENFTNSYNLATSLEGGNSPRENVAFTLQNDTNTSPINLEINLSTFSNPTRIHYSSGRVASSMAPASLSKFVSKSAKFSNLLMKDTSSANSASVSPRPDSARIPTMAEENITPLSIDSAGESLTTRESLEDFSQFLHQLFSSPFHKGPSKLWRKKFEQRRNLVIQSILDNVLLESDTIESVWQAVASMLFKEQQGRTRRSIILERLIDINKEIRNTRKRDLAWRTLLKEKSIKQRSIQERLKEQFALERSSLERKIIDITGKMNKVLLENEQSTNVCATLANMHLFFHQQLALAKEQTETESVDWNELEEVILNAFQSVTQQTALFEQYRQVASAKVASGVIEDSNTKLIENPIVDSKRNNSVAYVNNLFNIMHPRQRRNRINSTASILSNGASADANIAADDVEDVKSLFSPRHESTIQKAVPHLPLLASAKKMMQSELTKKSEKHTADNVYSASTQEVVDRDKENPNPLLSFRGGRLNSARGEIPGALSPNGTETSSKPSRLNSLISKTTGNAPFKPSLIADTEGLLKNYDPRSADDSIRKLSETLVELLSRYKYQRFVRTRQLERALNLVERDLRRLDIREFNIQYNQLQKKVAEAEQETANSQEEENFVRSKITSSQGKSASGATGNVVGGSDGAVSTELSTEVLSAKLKLNPSNGVASKYLSSKPIVPRVSYVQTVRGPETRANYCQTDMGGVISLRLIYKGSRVFNDTAIADVSIFLLREEDLLIRATLSDLDWPLFLYLIADSYVQGDSAARSHGEVKSAITGRKSVSSISNTITAPAGKITEIGKKGSNEKRVSVSSDYIVTEDKKRMSSIATMRRDSVSSKNDATGNAQAVDEDVLKSKAKSIIENLEIEYVQGQPLLTITNNISTVTSLDMTPRPTLDMECNYNDTIIYYIIAVFNNLPIILTISKCRRTRHGMGFLHCGISSPLLGWSRFASSPTRDVYRNANISTVGHLINLLLWLSYNFQTNIETLFGFTNLLLIKPIEKKKILVKSQLEQRREQMEMSDVTKKDFNSSIRRTRMKSATIAKTTGEAQVDSERKIDKPSTRFPMDKPPVQNTEPAAQAAASTGIEEAGREYERDEFEAATSGVKVNEETKFENYDALKTAAKRLLASLLSPFAEELRIVSDAYSKISFSPEELEKRDKPNAVTPSTSNALANINVTSSSNINDIAISSLLGRFPKTWFDKNMVIEASLSDLARKQLIQYARRVEFARNEVRMEALRKRRRHKARNGGRIGASIEVSLNEDDNNIENKRVIDYEATLKYVDFSPVEICFLSTKIDIFSNGRAEVNFVFDEEAHQREIEVFNEETNKKAQWDVERKVLKERLAKKIEASIAAQSQDIRGARRDANRNMSYQKEKVSNLFSTYSAIDYIKFKNNGSMIGTGGSNAYVAQILESLSDSEEGNVEEKNSEESSVEAGEWNVARVSVSQQVKPEGALNAMFIEPIAISGVIDDIIPQPMREELRKDATLLEYIDIGKDNIRIRADMKSPRESVSHEVEAEDGIRDEDMEFEEESNTHED